MKIIKFNNRHNKSHVINNKIIWESRSPAIVGVIIINYHNNDYVLINKRGKGTPNFNGYWNLPAGYLDWDENGYNGICREIYEETGVYIPDIIQNEIIIDNNMYQPFYVETEPNHLQNVSLSYGLYFKSNKLPILTDKHSEPDEIDDIRWILIGDIKKYKFAFDHNKRIIMYYNKIKKLSNHIKENFVFFKKI
jgi:8-oxo-dGTP pyrophosphatase MutT (NUDIX family)